MARLLLKIVVKALDFIVSRLNARNIYFGLNLLASILASLRVSKFVRVNHDGTDWIYRWGKTGAVQPVPNYDPNSNLADIDLFFFDYFPKTGDLIVNLGLENGSEIPSFCDSVGPNGHVFGIEADPACYRRLRKLKDILQLENLTLICSAAGAYEGEVAFSQNQTSNANRVMPLDGSFLSSILVRQDTLQQLLLPYGITEVDYAKVNIEGAESEVLRGILGSKLKVKNWCISCHDFIGIETRTYEYVRSWLSDANYMIKTYQPQQLTTPWRNYYLYGSIRNRSGILD